MTSQAISEDFAKVSDFVFIEQRVIPCQLIQKNKKIAPTISDFDETYLSGGTFGTDQEKLKFLKIGSVLTKL